MKEILKYCLYITAATLFIGIAYTSADFFTSPTHQLKDVLQLLFQWGILILALWPILFLLAINKYVFAGLYPLICFFSGLLMYFRYTTGTTFTTMILHAALDNDAQINNEFITPYLIIILVLSLAISIVFVVIRFRTIPKIPRMSVYGIFCIVVIAVLFNISKIKRPCSERIPFNLYFVTQRYFSEKQEIMKERPVLSENAVCGEEQDLTVVFILGESLRADHLGINGYKRNTTPYLSQEDIVSFPNIYSEYTYTNVSLPHILTRADSIHPELAYQERSFIDIFKHCGYHTVWLANQEPANTYVYFMNECDTLIYANANKSPYVFDKWTDGDLLPYFKQFVGGEERNRFILLHTIGSHWYYNSHFPDDFQQFNPVTKSRIVKSNTEEELINSYDNTVLYTDYFAHEIINDLRNKNAIIFYLSDHGEALGENGLWLHAAEDVQIKNPACWIWMSPRYKNENPDKYESLQAHKSKHYRTDFLFHTILEAAGIKSEVMDEKFSLF
jgi:glucan phosphoethanolaminetransferase (alkaline phosphatase superfamily)